MHILFELFALGTLTFYATMLALLFIIAALTEHNRGGWATIIAIGTIFGLNYLSHVPIFTAIRQHPLIAIGIVIGYLIVGVIWSMAKWAIYCLDQRTIALDPRVRHDVAPPVPRNNKDRIVTWMSYWPLNMVWTFFDDVVAKAFSMAFERFEGSYEKISQRMFKNVPTYDEKIKAEARAKSTI